MSTAKFARCYELYRGQIQHEDLLLSQRVTWIVTSQAVLLGCYVFLLNSPLPYAAVANADPRLSPSCENLVFNLAAFTQGVDLLRHVFQVVGLFSSIATCVSSVAAMLAVARLVGAYGRHLIAVEKGEEPFGYGAGEPGFSRRQIAAAVSRIQVSAGLPPIVTKRLYRIMGLAAPIFFGVVFAGAWVVLMFSLQHLSIVLPFILLPLLLGLVGVLLFKLNDRTAADAFSLEEADEA